jgi:hypothetical protein
MSEQAKKSDPLEGRWQPVAVVNLDKEPKLKPPRSLKNAAWDITSHVVLMAALWGGMDFLIMRDSRFALWMAACGALIGLISGIQNWWSRPIRLIRR